MANSSGQRGVKSRTLACRTLQRTNRHDIRYNRPLSPFSEITIISNIYILNIGHGTNVTGNQKYTIARVISSGCYYPAGYAYPAEKDTFAAAHINQRIRYFRLLSQVLENNNNFKYT